MANRYPLQLLLFGSLSKNGTVTYTQKRNKCKSLQQGIPPLKYGDVVSVYAQRSPGVPESGLADILVEVTKVNGRQITLTRVLPN